MFCDAARLLKEFGSYLEALNVLFCQSGFPKFPTTAFADSVVLLLLVLRMKHPGLS